MEQIRYLKKEEKQNTRQMYEAIFTEDTEAFVDYYYHWKIRDNEIIVMEDKRGYEVMIHLNPYSFKVNEAESVIPYIIAVATRPDSRRQGKMQRVMQKVLQDMQKSHCPFTFLLPANPDYYYGQGFVFSSKNQEKVIKRREKIVEWNRVLLKCENTKQMQQVVEIANTILAQKYDVYVQRDIAYYERLLEEVASEQGNVLIIEEKGKIIGILAYGKEEQAEIKEFLLLEQYETQKREICNKIFGVEGWNEEEMSMMFRITDLQAFQGLLKGENEVLTVEVTDSMIETNNGIWELTWNSWGGNVRPLPQAEVVKQQKIPQMDISELTKKIMEKMSIFIREWV